MSYPVALYIAIGSFLELGHAFNDCKNISWQENLYLIKHDIQCIRYNLLLLVYVSDM